MTGPCFWKQRLQWSGQAIVVSDFVFGRVLLSPWVPVGEMFYILLCPFLLNSQLTIGLWLLVSLLAWTFHILTCKLALYQAAGLHSECPYSGNRLKGQGALISSTVTVNISKWIPSSKPEFAYTSSGNSNNTTWWWVRIKWSKTNNGLSGSVAQQTRSAVGHCQHLFTEDVLHGRPVPSSIL